MHISASIVATILATAPAVKGYIAPRGTGNQALSTGSWGNATAWVTQTVTAYETYCPTPTKFKQGTKTYTATTQTWVTVTDCPQNGCTISNQAGVQPTVIPIGMQPKYNNTTVTPTNAQATSTKTGCPCANAVSTANGSTTRAPGGPNEVSSAKGTATETPCPCNATVGSGSTSAPAPGSGSSSSSYPGSASSSGNGSESGSGYGSGSGYSAPSYPGYGGASYPGYPSGAYNSSYGNNGSNKPVAGQSSGADKAIASLYGLVFLAVGFMAL